MSHKMLREEMVSLSRVKLTKLVAAFEKDSDEKVVEAILKTRGDVNYAIPFSKNSESVDHMLQPGTILHQMRKLNESKISKVLNLLINHGADITVKNNQGQTALHSEFTYQYKNSSNCTFDSPIVNALLTAHIEHKIHQNPRDDSSGITHFHIACMTKHVKAIDFFLSASQFYEQEVINRGSQIFPGSSSLHLAANRQCTEAVKKLVELYTNVCLKDAERLAPVQILIKRNLTITNGKIDGHRIKDLINEYELNQKIILVLSVKETINSNNNNGTQFIKDEYGFSNFHAACTLDDTSLAKSLVTYVQDDKFVVNGNLQFCHGYTPLHFAAHFNFDLVKLLLNSGANITATDANGVTPFEICLQTQSIENIEYLLSTNPKWRNIVMSDGKTKMLSLISSMKSESEFDRFLSQMEDKNLHVVKSSPLWPGYTVLHFAVLFSERLSAKFHELRPFKDDDSFPDKLPLDTSLVNQCLAHGADVCAQDSHGSSPIHLAYYAQKSCCIVRLFEKIPDDIVDYVDDKGISLLHIVCGSPEETDVVLDVIDNLVINGADMNLPIGSSYKSQAENLSGENNIVAGSTPLHLAVIAGNVEVAKLLLRHGADVNAINKDGWSPVHMVLLSSFPEKMGRALLTFTAKLQERVVEDIGLNHLHVACYVDSLRGVKKLIKLGSDLNATVINREQYEGFTPLHFAVQRGSTKVTSVLLNVSADILAKSVKGVSPLYEVLSASTDDELIELFVKHIMHDKDLQKRLEKDSGMTLLHLVAFTMNFEAVEQLLNSGADVNARVHDNSPIWPGYTVLHAWHYGYTKFDYRKQRLNNTLKLLLNAGADVTLADAKLDTPLHLFSYLHVTIDDQDTLSTGRLLLNSQKDCGINPFNAARVSHFHIAVQMCDVGMVEKFLKSGADVNERVDYWYNAREYKVINSGCNPLHLLTYGHSRYLKYLPDRIDTIDLLLKYGADVNARDVFDDTPLHAAVVTEVSLDNVVEKIIRAGGKVDAANIAGETPFALLAKSKLMSSSKVEFFLQQGCRTNVYNVVDRTGFLSLPLLVCPTFKQADEIYEALFKSPDITSIDYAGRTAIHNIVSLPINTYARTNVYSHVIKRLVELGCDIDAQDHTGKVALHNAAAFKNHAAVEALLEKGADINLLSKNGKSAFDYSLKTCGCSVKKSYHYHAHVVHKILKYIQTLELAGLHVNKHNVNLIPVALRRCGTILPNLTKANTELEKTKLIKIGNSNTLRLYDFLSETGAVAAYPTMPRALRQAVDEFFTRDNKALEEFNEIVGLIRLQYRKTMKRVELFRLGIDSLRALSGIPLPELVCENLMRCLSFTDVQSLVASTNNFEHGRAERNLIIL